MMVLMHLKRRLWWNIDSFLINSWLIYVDVFLSEFQIMSYFL